MQAPANEMSMSSSSTSTTTVNTTYQTPKEAAEAWAACLAEVTNSPEKYPRMPIENGPFANFKEMWTAKENGDYDPSKRFIYPPLLPPIPQNHHQTTFDAPNPVNSFKHPKGPKSEHIKYLQGLHHRGMTIDEIALRLVTVYPDLMKGWHTGTEYDRRLQIHGLVNIWTSIWAPQVLDDGRMVQKEDTMMEEEGGESEIAGGQGPLFQFRSSRLAVDMDSCENTSLR